MSGAGVRATASSGARCRPATRLTLLMTVHDRARHAGLENKLVQRARRAGLAGATVFEGREGYGSSGRRHRTGLVSDDAPLAIVIVDEPGRIDAFVADAADLLAGVLAVRDDIEIVEL